VAASVFGQAMAAFYYSSFFSLFDVRFSAKGGSAYGTIFRGSQFSLSHNSQLSFLCLFMAILFCEIREMCGSFLPTFQFSSLGVLTFFAAFDYARKRLIFR